MTTEDAIDLLGRLTYKPRYKFQAYMADSDEVILRLSAPVNCASGKNPKKMVQINVMDSMPISQLEAAEEGDVIAWVESLIRRFEVHETNEWFKIDGKHVNVPSHGERV